MSGTTLTAVQTIHAERVEGTGDTRGGLSGRPLREDPLHVWESGLRRPGQLADGCTQAGLRPVIPLLALPLPALAGYRAGRGAAPAVSSVGSEFPTVQRPEPRGYLP